MRIEDRVFIIVSPIYQVLALAYPAYLLSAEYKADFIHVHVKILSVLGFIYMIANLSCYGQLILFRIILVLYSFIFLTFFESKGIIKLIMVIHSYRSSYNISRALIIWMEVLYYDNDPCLDSMALEVVTRLAFFPFFINAIHPTPPSMFGIIFAVPFSICLYYSAYLVCKIVSLIVIGLFIILYAYHFFPRINRFIRKICRKRI